MSRRQSLRLLTANAHSTRGSSDTSQPGPRVSWRVPFWGRQGRTTGALLRGVQLAASFAAEQATSPDSILRTLSLDPHTLAVLVADEEMSLTGGAFAAVDAGKARRILPLLPSGDNAVLHAVIGRGFADFAILPIRALELTAHIELRLRDTLRDRSGTDSEHPPVASASVLIDVVRNNWPIRLTRREYSLFEYLASREGSVVARAELLANVWGKPDCNAGTSNVVDAYICYLRNKLANVVPPVRIKTIQSAGYVMSITQAPSSDDTPTA